MTLGEIGTFAITLTWPPVCGWIYTRLFRWPFWRNVLWCAIGMIGGSFIPPIDHVQERDTWATCSLWALIALWNLTRRKRQRASSLIGEKSRALRDTLVKRAREGSARPIPAPS